MRFAPVLAVLLAACAGSPSNVLAITVDASGRVPGVEALLYSVMHGGTTWGPTEERLPVPADIPPVRYLRTVLPRDRHGPVRVFVEAVVGGRVVASASGDGTLESGAVRVVLPGALAMDGGLEADLREPVDAGAVGLDALAVNDLGASDSARPPDMATPPPDLARSDLLPSADLAPPPVASCRARLAAGDTMSGARRVPVGAGSMLAFCDQSGDGGGWLLAYSNANNWAGTTAGEITSVNTGTVVYRWFDSRWRLTTAADGKRLGKPWDGADPLMPDAVGGNGLKALYDAGYTQVRVEFIRGGDGATASGWCDTGGAWDWSATNAKPWRCKKTGAGGSGHMVCLGGRGAGQLCDGTAWNNGWTIGLALGDGTWDYAYQGAHNHLSPEGDHVGARADHMVAIWQRTQHDTNAAAGDYQVRVWLREPQ